MKFFVNAAIAISLFAPAAYAGNDGALSALLTQAGAEAVTVTVPEVREALSAPLASGLADLDAAQANALASAARSSGYAVFELDGTKIQTKPGLMAYAAQALGLPADMDNWDAMIDYLGDMPTFHHNNNIVILVRNASAIQQADPKLYADLRNVAQLSCENANEWSRSAVSMKFVFIP
jgi:hypothetical protein